MGYRQDGLFSLEIVDIKNEQIQQNEVSLGRWIVDAITLLLSRGESCNLKKLIPVEQLGLSYIPDIYLEKGCDALNLSGKTIIDIKYNLLYDSEIKQSEIYQLLINKHVIDNLIVVYIKSNGFRQMDSVPSQRLEFIAAEDFINRAKDAIATGKGMINIALRNGQKQQGKTWIEVREDHLANAINDMSQHDSVLFLGAGVSASAQVPKWNFLLKALMADKVDSNSKRYDAVMREMDYSNLMMARYIRKAANLNKETLVENVRRLLYSETLEDSELIASVCAIIKSQQRVKSVITYNYDTLIEDFLNRNGKRSYSVYRNNHSDGNSFPVYHVHGIVFRDGANKIPEDIVLSEEDYHEVYSHVYDWSNVEQLHALSRCTCFFIGLSLKDPNLRRLLEISKRGSGKAVRHYAFLERTSLCENEVICEKDYQIREDMLADLGLNVIWYSGKDNHKELPELLKRFIQRIETM